MKHLLSALLSAKHSIYQTKLDFFFFLSLFLWQRKQPLTSLLIIFSEVFFGVEELGGERVRGTKMEKYREEEWGVIEKISIIVVEGVTEVNEGHLRIPTFCLKWGFSLPVEAFFVRQVSFASSFASFLPLSLLLFPGHHFSKYVVPYKCIPFNFSSFLKFSSCSLIQISFTTPYQAQGISGFTLLGAHENEYLIFDNIGVYFSIQSYSSFV